MTLEQLQLLKQSYMKPATRTDGSKSTCGEYMKICLDGGIDIVTSKDLVTFDDTNEMIHAVCINDDMRSQADFPVKVINSTYSMIQTIETIMTQENFETFLEEGYLKDTSTDRKNVLINWTRKIKNVAQQPIRAVPYFKSEDEPLLIPKASTRINRESFSEPIEYEPYEPPVDDGETNEDPIDPPVDGGETNEDPVDPPVDENVEPVIDDNTNTEEP